MEPATPAPKKIDGRSRAAREWQKQYQKEFTAYFEAMINCRNTRLTAEERQAYDEWEHGGWEADFPGQPYPGDSSWPGWKKYIGPPPWKKVKQ